MNTRSAPFSLTQARTLLAAPMPAEPAGAGPARRSRRCAPATEAIGTPNITSRSNTSRAYRPSGGASTPAPHGANWCGRSSRNRRPTVKRTWA